MTEDFMLDTILAFLSQNYDQLDPWPRVVFAGPVAILILIVLREGLIHLRYSGARFRAAREKIVGRNAGWAMLFAALVLCVTVWGAFVIGETPPFNWSGLKILVVWTVSAFAAGAIVLVLRSKRAKAIATFIPPCPRCKLPMQDISEKKIAERTENEQKEIRAGGRKLEAWHCLACSVEEIYDKLWHEAVSCPQCKLRTLRRSAVVTQRATSSRSGKMKITIKCHNDACGYSKVSERGISRTGKR